MHNEAEVLAQTYWHKADIKRPKKVKHGSLSSFEELDIYGSLPCAVSFKQGSTEGLGDTTQPIHYVALLFARPDVVILAGDTVEVTFENGRSQMFLAGETIYYPSHIEVPLIREGYADGR